jgi:predicted nucleic acid-binding Zn ribbon protein
MKKRESNEQSIGEAIDRLLKVYKLENKLTEVDLVNSWEQIMGKHIAKHTTELYIKNGKMTVRLDSSVLREELHYAKQRVLEMLNEKAGKKFVTEIVFK